MSAAALLERAKAAGVTVTVRDGSMKVIGQPDDIRLLIDDLRSSKAEILALLVSEKTAANDPAPDPDRHCYPHTEAANTAEMSAMSTRLERFAGLGLAIDQAEKMADKLQQRDREADDRHACLECGHLSGRWRCGAFRQRGATAPGLPADYIVMLTRCNAWRAAV